MAKTGFLSLMFLLLFAASRSTLSAKSPNNSADQSALLALKSHITRDPHNLLATNWSTSTYMDWCHLWVQTQQSCCSEFVKYESHKHHPISIRKFIFPHLARHSSQQLTNRRRLECLNFGNNSFDGEIPAWFGYFPELRSLIMHDNNFTGVIPSALGNLSS
ncbi:hypothetical protein V6N12_047004 [Hibiscus sabdariffa]|uniref:Leucine-rich repeat-containing N-terminal plant-type domain-containing protein n=1 Tax=Hibiscus sabdariffa TaxID=183260 RepID=A0ABR2BC98_9ROSI